jgi:hypothetical protein
VHALRHLAPSLELEASGGWAMLYGSDARAPYPGLFCDDWSRLADDYESLRAAGARSFVARVPGERVDDKTWDTIGSRKPQYVARPEASWSSHARRRAVGAMKESDVIVADDPSDWSEHLVVLYATLRRRHGFDGYLEDFPPWSLKEQLEAHGTVVFVALGNHVGGGFGRRLLGMLVWYEMGDTARYHLGAYSHDGYEISVSYALFAKAFSYFADRVEWLDLGRTPDPSPVPVAKDGLARFKLGLGAETRTSFMCSKVFR